MAEGSGANLHLLFHFNPLDGHQIWGSNAAIGLAIANCCPVMTVETSTKATLSLQILDNLIFGLKNPMSAKVSSFEKVKLGDYDYLFLVVAWSDYAITLDAEWHQYLEKFGEQVGLQGLVVQAYAKDQWTTGEQVLAKPWGDFRVRLEEEPAPFLLIIATDFDRFDPRQHPWAIIWISDFFTNPTAIPHLLGWLGRTVNHGQDLFARLAERQHDPIQRSLVSHPPAGGPGFLVGNKALEDDTLTAYCQRVRQAIAGGDLRQGLSYLRALNMPRANEVLLLSHRLESLRLEQIRGALREEEERVERNKIAAAVLDLLTLIEMTGT